MLALALALAVSTTRTLRVPVGANETLTVQMVGAGAPVVMIPGLFGSAYTFRNVLPLLTAAGYEVIIIEPLAMGTSSRPGRSDYSLSAQAARIAAVLDTLHLQGAVVVGHSLGASIAYRLALRRPDLVLGIVSLEGGPSEAAATPGFRRAMSLAPLIRLAGSGFIRGRIHRSLIEASGDTTWVSDEVIAEYTAGATADLGATLRAYIRMGEAREPERLAPRLGELRCQVRLLLGAAPHNGGPGEQEQQLMQQAIPDFRTERVPGAGHYLQEERPDVVVAAVRGVSDAAPVVVGR